MEPEKVDKRSLVGHGNALKYSQYAKMACEELRIKDLKITMGFKMVLNREMVF